MLLSRIIIQLLCLLSYIWVSTGVANAMQLYQASVQEPTAQIIVDDDRHRLILHHQGYRDSHEPKANGAPHIHSDHVIKLSCAHPEFSALASHVKLAKVKIATDVLVAYLPPPVFSYTAFAQKTLVAQQPPPANSPPLSRNSSIAIVQLTQLRI